MAFGLFGAYGFSSNHNHPARRRAFAGLLAVRSRYGWPYALANRTSWIGYFLESQRSSLSKRAPTLPGG
jgi:hypothetical protein